MYLLILGNRETHIGLTWFRTHLQWHCRFRKILFQKTLIGYCALRHIPKITQNCLDMINQTSSAPIFNIMLVYESIDSIHAFVGKTVFNICLEYPYEWDEHCFTNSNLFSLFRWLISCRFWSWYAKGEIHLSQILGTIKRGRPNCQLVARCSVSELYRRKEPI